MPTSSYLFILSFTFIKIAPLLTRAQPFDYPTANLSTTWTNNDLLTHVVKFDDGSKVRPILLRLNPNFYGPSFACGFYCNGACDAYLFAVFIVDANSGGLITNPSFAFPQVVWSANRDRLVKENATLELTAKGDLVLKEVNGSVVWSTGTAGKSVAGMQVAQSGNLILTNLNNASVWQSFDHPTDTLVAGQQLWDGMSLSANTSYMNSAAGQFSLTVSGNGFRAYVGSTPRQLYYSYGGDRDIPNLYLMLNNGSLGLYSQINQSASELKANSPLPLASSVQYMRLEFDGHLRLYDWEVNGWAVVMDFLQLGDCEYPTVCGEYGVCAGAGECSCPVAANGSSGFFAPIDRRQKDLGCSPVNDISCPSMQEHQMIAVTNVSYFNLGDLAAATFQEVDENRCVEACLNNCSCKASFFKYEGDISRGYCFLPSELFSLQLNPQPAHNDRSHISTRIKLQMASSKSPANPNSTDTLGNTPGINLKVILFSVFGSLFVVALVIGSIAMIVRRKADTEEDDEFEQVPGMPRRFTFEDLKVATTDFTKKLGEGGFGSVYKGTIDGEMIAVKRLDGVGQGKREFLAEVLTIGNVHHFNLVRLVGFCAEKSHRLLVYEFMPNGSLDRWIFKKDQHLAPLDWKTRYKIITGIAKGLSYLHEECRQRIAHLDIKPQNILLDENFNAKVSDFGLAKLIDRDKKEVMTRMRGTPGYLAPEWLTSIISEKVDIYSFGIVIMEILCGRKNLDYSQAEENIHLITLLQNKIQENQILDIVESHGIDIDLYQEEVNQMIKLAVWCLQIDCDKRPSMSMVVKVLEGETHDVQVELDFNIVSNIVLNARKEYQSDSDSSAPTASLLSGPR